MTREGLAAGCQATEAFVALAPSREIASAGDIVASDRRILDQ